MTDDLIGRCIELNNIRYRVTEIRHVNGQVMVYAEQVNKSRGPQRAAFHLDDVQNLLRRGGAAG